MVDVSKLGHRDRLRERFARGEDFAHTDESLLELLLSYSIPQKDVRPLAGKLLQEFGSLSGVLAASREALCRCDGIKSYTATLIKLVDWLRTHHARSATQQDLPRVSVRDQPSLFPSDITEGIIAPEAIPATASKPAKIVPRRGTQLFGKAVLKEAIELLPKVPETESLDEIRKYLRSHLHYSAQETRRRYADYIIHRMFPLGYADWPMRAFAKHFPGSRPLREVCFYRFMKAEPIVEQTIAAQLVPSLGVGRLSRDRIRAYLSSLYPRSKSIHDCATGIVSALAAGGIAKADRQKVTFAYRDIPLPAFSFILHSEFPEPGMFDLAKLEGNKTILAMLWDPSRLLPSLYELRNQGIISKISEIDNVRQLTTKWSLKEVVERLIARGKPA